jgi:TPR repeat protein
MKGMTLFLMCLLMFLSCEGQDPAGITLEAKAEMARGNIHQSVLLYRQAAELGNAEAQYTYGYYFLKGIEVRRDDSIASHWLLQSARQGWKAAQQQIAVNYFNGTGIPRNVKEGFYWALLCARQNDPTCMEAVADYYKRASAPEGNPDSALVWTIRLASLSDLGPLKDSGKVIKARKSLALKYDAPDDPQRDPQKSYTWYLIYNEDKRYFSSVEQESNIESIQRLKKELSGKQRKRAAADAEKQLGRKLRNRNRLFLTET